MNEPEPNSIKKQVASEALQLLPRAYDDLLKPAAQELGKGLGTIAKSLNIVLSPLAGVVWGFDQLKEFLIDDVSRRLAERGTRRITTPKASVAVPTLGALTYLGNEAELRDLFANLLVSATDVETADNVHPAFVEIIKQLSADEAKILSSLKSRKYFPFVCEGEYNDTEGYHDAHSMLSKLYTDFDKIGRSAGIKEDVETGHYLDNLLRLRLFEVKAVSDVELSRGFPVHNDREYEIERTRYEALYVTKLRIRFLDLCVCPSNAAEVDKRREGPAVTSPPSGDA